MKNKAHYVLLAMMMCMAMFAFGGISAQAKGAYLIVPFEQFDANYFALRYPDAVEQCGTDATTLYKFYVNNYIAYPLSGGHFTKDKFFRLEGATYFDAIKYAEENPDVAAVLGTNTNVLYNHYITCGIYEGRKATFTEPCSCATVKMLDVIETEIGWDTPQEEQIHRVHDWIVNNVNYDYYNYLNGTLTYDDYRMYGPVLAGVGVCEGYAETFQGYMDLLGIPCAIVSGTNHAWNRVMVNGEWRQIDCTWDDPIVNGDPSINGLRYDYYLLTDEEMAQIHGPEKLVSRTVLSRRWLYDF